MTAFIPSHIDNTQTTFPLCKAIFQEKTKKNVQDLLGDCDSLDLTMSNSNTAWEPVSEHDDYKRIEDKMLLDFLLSKIVFSDLEAAVFELCFKRQIGYVEAAETLSTHRKAIDNTCQLIRVKLQKIAQKDLEDNHVA